MASESQTATIARYLADLTEEAHAIGEIKTRWPEEPLKHWVERARALASDVGAESVSITAGFPWGLSVSVTLKP